MSSPCLEAPSPDLLKGIEEFNRKEFFECHETLERLWMDEPRSIRRLYQGILQVGVAFHHLQAGRYLPVVTLLKRGSQYLEPYAPQCMGVNIADLLRGSARCLAAIQELGQDGLNKFNWSLVPRIETRQPGQDNGGISSVDRVDVEQLANLPYEPSLETGKTPTTHREQRRK